MEEEKEARTKEAGMEGMKKTGTKETLAQELRGPKGPNHPPGKPVQQS